jgi:hypothetical protein
MYGRETSYMSLREEYCLRVYENWVVTGIFGASRKRESNSRRLEQTS